MLLSAAFLSACGVDPSLINGDDVSPVLIFAGQMAEGSANSGAAPRPFSQPGRYGMARWPQRPRPARSRHPA